jgi:hypothetical protein
MSAGYSSDDYGVFSQFHSARPSKTPWIEGLIGAGRPQIEGFIPEGFTSGLKLKGNRPAFRADSIHSAQKRITIYREDRGFIGIVLNVRNCMVFYRRVGSSR